MSDKFSLSDIQKVNDAMRETNDTDKPYAVQSDEDLMVIGDANETEKVTRDFYITFRFEREELETLPKGAKEVGDWVLFTQKFENVFIRARDDMKILEACWKIYPFFTKNEHLLEVRDGAIDKLQKEYGCELRADGTTTLSGKRENEFLKAVEKIEEQYTFDLVHEYNYGDGEQISQAVYNFVKVLLNLDDYMANHMVGLSVLTAFLDCTVAFPEVFKETETLFGLSSTVKK